ncbi:MAG: 2-oxo acid dehydrogenase subunit E2 [Acidobacteria bacterium]|nr:2-oxo acid dehydrogenase subunit E2 [Acidobacteriota bacterium]
MNIKVTMPQMGESVYEGTLTKWLKKKGETVTRDEPLFEVSTDKVDSEIPSPASGILSEILVAEGETVKIDTVLAVIDDSSVKGAREEVADSPRENAPEPPLQEPAEEKPSGEHAGGELRDQAMPAEEEIAPSDEKPLEKKSEGIRVQSIRTSPLVRKIARENNIDLQEVPGTGLEGRITKEDILKYVEELSAAETARLDKASAVDVGASGEQESKALETGLREKPSEISETLGRFVGESERVPMSPMRKAIAEHMVFSKRTSAHVHTVFEVNLHRIVQLRERHKEEFKRREGISLTYTPFFAKALVDNVREFPVFNASVSGDAIVYKKPVNLGIAVALDTGLIVPVIKNAHLKSLTGIALKIFDLAERARTKRLKPEDVHNGTISLTNPGLYGALFATPIISQPQVAILGIGGIEKRPIVIDDAIAIRPMVCLSLSYDHRVIDGAVADQFMAALRDKLQSWTQWTE